MRNNFGERFLPLFLSTRWLSMIFVWWRHYIIVSCGWFLKAIFYYTVTYLASCVYINNYCHVCTSKHIIYYVGHPKLALKTFLVASWDQSWDSWSIMIISVSYKLLPRWLVCASDRKWERSLILKMKHCYMYTLANTHSQTATSIHVLTQFPEKSKWFERDLSGKEI